MDEDEEEDGLQRTRKKTACMILILSFLYKSSTFCCTFQYTGLLKIVFTRSSNNLLKIELEFQCNKFVYLLISAASNLLADSNSLNCLFCTLSVLFGISLLFVKIKCY